MVCSGGVALDISIVLLLFYGNKEYQCMRIFQYIIILVFGISSKLSIVPYSTPGAGETGFREEDGFGNEFSLATGGNTCKLKAGLA